MSLENNALIQIKCSGSSYMLSSLRSHYDGEYLPILKDYITENEFQTFLCDINDVISKYWPSRKVFIAAFVFIPLTFGFSLMLPLCCLS